MSTDPMPQRLSDAERDAAVDMLRQHYTDGRLDESEFSDRMGAALAARYPNDLAPLFEDLPEPRPSGVASGPAGWQQWTPSGSPPAPVPWSAPPTGVQPTTSNRGLSMARALIWPVCIVLLITTSWFWWIFVAIIGSIVFKQLEGDQRKPPPAIGR